MAEPAPPEPIPEATPPAMDPIAAALLGTNKKPSSDGAVLRAARQPQVGIDRAVKPRPTRTAPPEEPEEEPDEPVEPEIATTLTDTRFSRVVANWRGVKDCLSNAVLAERTERTGALSVAFVIGPDGVVKESKIIDTSNDLARQIAPCVSRQAKKIRFPTYAGTDDVAKEAKFVF